MAVSNAVPSRFDETSELAEEDVEFWAAKRARLHRARQWLARADLLTWKLEELMLRDVSLLDRGSPLLVELRELCRASGRPFHPVTYMQTKEALDALFDGKILLCFMLEVADLRHLLPGDDEEVAPCPDG